jgi:hypothetical protein
MAPAQAPSNGSSTFGKNHYCVFDDEVDHYEQHPRCFTADWSTAMRNRALTLMDDNSPSVAARRVNTLDTSVGATGHGDENSSPSSSNVNANPSSTPTPQNINQPGREVLSSYMVRNRLGDAAPFFPAATGSNQVYDSITDTTRVRVPQNASVKASASQPVPTPKVQSNDNNGEATKTTATTKFSTYAPTKAAIRRELDSLYARVDYLTEALLDHDDAIGANSVVYNNFKEEYNDTLVNLRAADRHQLDVNQSLRVRDLQNGLRIAWLEKLIWGEEPDALLSIDELANEDRRRLQRLRSSTASQHTNDPYASTRVSRADLGSFAGIRYGPGGNVQFLDSGDHSAAEPAPPTKIPTTNKFEGVQIYPILRDSLIPATVAPSTLSLDIPKEANKRTLASRPGATPFGAFRSGYGGGYGGSLAQRSIIVPHRVIWDFNDPAVTSPDRTQSRQPTVTEEADEAFVDAVEDLSDPGFQTGEDGKPAMNGTFSIPQYTPAQRRKAAAIKAAQAQTEIGAKMEVDMAGRGEVTPQYDFGNAVADALAGRGDYSPQPSSHPRMAEGGEGVGEGEHNGITTYGGKKRRGPFTMGKGKATDGAGAHMLFYD